MECEVNNEATANGNDMPSNPISNMPTDLPEIQVVSTEGEIETTDLTGDEFWEGSTPAIDTIEPGPPDGETMLQEVASRKGDSPRDAITIDSREPTPDFEMSDLPKSLASDGGPSHAEEPLTKRETSSDLDADSVEMWQGGSCEADSKPYDSDDSEYNTKHTLLSHGLKQEIDGNDTGFRPEYSEAEDSNDSDDGEMLHISKKRKLNDSSGQKSRSRPSKPRGKHARNADEQALKRHAKEEKKLKEQIRKLMKTKGPDITPQEIYVQTKPRRKAPRTSNPNAAPKFQSDTNLAAKPHQGLASTDAPQRAVTKRQRNQEISQADGGVSMNNRRSGSQKTDLREAMKVFGYNMCKCVETDGQKLYKVNGMQTALKEWQLVATAWMVKRETDLGPPLGGVLADVPGMGKTVMTLATIAGHRPNAEASANAQTATLIVLPNATVAAQWREEISKHVGTVLAGNIVNYRKINNELGLQILGQCWIVLTTYQEIVCGYPSKEELENLEGNFTTTVPGKDGRQEKFFDAEGYDKAIAPLISDLFRVNWYRVVLDEVHQIKNFDGRTCHSAQKLRAKHFWGLSGTPLVNRKSELLPYLKIIGYAKEETLQEFKTNYDDSPPTRNRIDAIMNMMTYRRTEEDLFLGEKMLDLPVSHPGDQWVTLSAEERIIYDLTSQWYETIGAQYACAKTMRQRQAVSHPYLLEKFLRGKTPHVDKEYLQLYIEALTPVEGKTPVYMQMGSWERRHDESRGSVLSGFKPSKWALGQSSFGKELKLVELFQRVMNEKELDDSTCLICKESGPGIHDPYIITCGHIFCHQCIIGAINKCFIAGKKAFPCPKCRLPFDNDIKPLLTLDLLEQREIKPVKDTSGHKEKKKRKRGNVLGQPDPPAEPPRPGEDFLKFRPSFDTLENTFFSKAVHVNEFGGEYGVPIPSAKTAAVKETVLRWQEEDPNDKGIIFTQFVMTSQVIGRMLQLEGIGFVFLNGKMTPNQKSKAVQAFKDNPNVKYMVASMRCGGQALNLTCANRVILVDIWWNQAAEKQAFGRVFRLGQIKQTHLVRILARDTIDESIRQKQDTKQGEIDKIMQDDRHETNIFSEWHNLALVDPERYNQMIFRLIREIKDEDEDSKASMDVKVLET